MEERDSGDIISQNASKNVLMKKRLIFLFKISISVLLIGYLITLIDFDQLIAQFKRIQYFYLVAAFLLLLFQVALSSFKWKIILEADGVQAPYLFLLRTYLIGNFISLFLPSSFGGDIYRVYAIKSATSTLSKSTSSVLFDRLSGLFALVSISLLSYVFLTDKSYDWQLVFLYGLLIAGFFVGSSRNLIDYSRRWLPGKLKKLTLIMESFNVYSKNPKVIGLVILISLFFQFNIVVINNMYCDGLGIDISFIHLLIVIPLVYITEALPISINGLGVRESAFVFFFTMLGFAKEEAIAVAILVVLMRYLLGLVGGGLLLFSVIRAK